MEPMAARSGTVAEPERLSGREPARVFGGGSARVMLNGQPGAWGQFSRGDYNKQDHQVTIYATITPSTPQALADIIASSEPPTGPAVPDGVALSAQHPRM
jgi:hypothetical protein